uniref:Recombination endonuclease subunit n=1 Tax=Pseudomonas phage Cygsa01 TaxID=3138529 RepID=A0AAU6W3N1_9VIRU
MSDKVILKKVRSKNFRSVGNSFIEVDLQAHNTSLVVSVDNGAGKSTTTISALYYGLFDKAYGEKARKTSLINSKSNKDSLVEVEFVAKGREYLVRRGQKPAVFEVYEDGEVWKNDSDNTDNQTRLLGVLGFDHVIFENVIALGRDRFVPFIKMDAATRRHVADEMLSTGIFGVMNELAKEDLKELNRKVSDVEFETNTVTQKLEAAERLVAQHNTNRGEIVEGARARIAELEDDLTKKGDLRTRLDTKRQETAGEAARITDELAAVQQSVENLQEGFDKRIVLRRAETQKVINELSDKFQSSLRSIAAEQRTRLEEATKAGRTAVDEASSSLQRMKGILGDLQRKAATEGAKATSFRSLGDCPTCLQVVPGEHKDRIAGEIEETVAQVNAGVAKLEPKISDAEAALQKAKDDAAKATDSVVEWTNTEAAKVESECGKAVQMAKQAELDTELDTIRAEANEATATLREQMVPLKGQNQEFVSKLNELNTAIATLDGQISSVQGEIKTQQGVIERNLDQGADEQLKKLEAEKGELSARLTELTKSYNDLKAEAKSFSEMLVILKDNGVKADVVKQYIPFFNKRVNELLDGMGMYINFVMDEDFNIEMADPTRKNQNLYDLSTGQQRRIDLAILFVWREIASMKSSISCNLLILDEVLENLSQQGVVDFMGMFENEYGGKTNLMVITQREDEFSEYFDHVIKYQLRDDFTVLLEGAE